MLGDDLVAVRILPDRIRARDTEVTLVAPGDQQRAPQPESQRRARQHLLRGRDLVEERAIAALQLEEAARGDRRSELELPEHTGGALAQARVEVPVVSHRRIPVALEAPRGPAIVGLVAHAEQTIS